MAGSTHTIGVLARAAAETIDKFPPEARIKIYQALGESLPNETTRASARELARILSRAAALELEFQKQMRIKTTNKRRTEADS